MHKMMEMMFNLSFGIYLQTKLQAHIDKHWKRVACVLYLWFKWWTLYSTNIFRWLIWCWVKTERNAKRRQYSLKEMVLQSNVNNPSVKCISIRLCFHPFTSALSCNSLKKNSVPTRLHEESDSHQFRNPKFLFIFNEEKTCTKYVFPPTWWCIFWEIITK